MMREVTLMSEPLPQASIWWGRWQKSLIFDGGREKTHHNCNDFFQRLPLSQNFVLTGLACRLGRCFCFAKVSPGHPHPLTMWVLHNNIINKRIVLILSVLFNPPVTISSRQPPLHKWALLNLSKQCRVRCLHRTVSKYLFDCRLLRAKTLPQASIWWGRWIGVSQDGGRERITTNLLPKRYFYR